MNRFIERHPFWTFVFFLLVIFLLLAVFAVWPKGLIAVVGKKKVFVNALLNGVTLGALYFLVASGFTLIFGLMRNVNLAHGSLYLLGGYIGYEFVELTGYWVLGFVAAFVLVGLIGVVLQVVVFRRMEGEDLRQTLVTIGISIVVADLMLWAWGGDFYQILTPDWLSGPVVTPIVSVIKRSGVRI